MAEKNKTSMYLLLIVGIVAVVGIVVLLLQGSQPFIYNDGDIAGAATVARAPVNLCSEQTEAEDCDGYACVTGKCKSSCNSDSECAEGYYCLAKPGGGECYEESEEGYTASGTVGDSVEYNWYNVYNGEWSGDCRSVESNEYKWVDDSVGAIGRSSKVKNVYGCQANNQLYFQTPGTEKRSYVTWTDNSNFRPSKAISVNAGFYIKESNKNDHAVIMAKLTTKCGYPLYSLVMEEGKFYFIISINNQKYKVGGDLYPTPTTLTTLTTSSSSSIGDWYYYSLRAEYENGYIKMYDGETGDIVAGVYAPGTISSNYAPSDFVLGRSTVCDDFQFQGLLMAMNIEGANE